MEARRGTLGFLEEDEVILPDPRILPPLAVDDVFGYEDDEGVIEAEGFSPDSRKDWAKAACCIQFINCSCMVCASLEDTAPPIAPAPNMPA